MKRLLSISLTLAAAGFIDACVGIGREPNRRIEFTGQSNIIVWDEHNHLEHFIRSAKFKTTSEEFDFIAPTPSVPEIGVAKQASFTYLRSITTPPERPGEREYSAGAAGSGGKIREGQVQVFQESEVGNFHIVTLKASDPNALKKWLTENDYRVSQSVDEWFNFYIKKEWYLTAFRVISKNPTIKTEAIRMSFSTNQPYNPYYVPKENCSAEAALELFLVTPREMVGVVDHEIWRVPFIAKAPIPVKKFEQFARDMDLNESDIPTNATVYRFIDYGFAKGKKDDLLFYPKQ